MMYGHRVGEDFYEVCRQPLDIDDFVRRIQAALPGYEPLVGPHVTQIRGGVAPPPPPSPPPPPPPGGAFLLGHFGDSGLGSNYQGCLNRAAAIGIHALSHTGDFSYTTSSSGAAQFYNMMNATLPGIPKTGAAGNHDSNISDYLNSWPAPGGYQGQHLVRGYIDLPVGAPLIRLLNVTPGVGEISGRFPDTNYSIGSSNGNWLRDRIREARALGLWVDVSMHKNWIDCVSKGNEMGSSCMELLITEEVDFITQGHSHVYERSKQFMLPMLGGTNATIRSPGPNYQKGGGPVILVCGNGGVGLRSFSCSDPDVPKFADGGGICGKAFYAEFGVTVLEVTPSMVQGKLYRNDGTVRDVFSIQ